MKQIFVVFQDCWKCANNKPWAEAQMEIASELGIEIVPMSFAEKGAREYILAAADKGVRLPFFTDGKKFSRYVNDFAPKKEPAKRGARKKKGASDGQDKPTI